MYARTGCADLRRHELPSRRRINTSAIHGRACAIPLPADVLDTALMAAVPISAHHRDSSHRAARVTMSRTPLTKWSAGITGMHNMSVLWSLTSAWPANIIPDRYEHGNRQRT